jgi:hypothetical protein
MSIGQATLSEPSLPDELLAGLWHTRTSAFNGCRRAGLTAQLLQHLDTELLRKPTKPFALASAPRCGSVRLVNSGSCVSQNVLVMLFSVLQSRRYTFAGLEVKCGITSVINSSSERTASSCGKPNDAP